VKNSAMFRYFFCCYVNIVKVTMGWAGSPDREKKYLKEFRQNLLGAGKRKER
jgi:hypothetical protein